MKIESAHVVIDITRGRSKVMKAIGETTSRHPTARIPIVIKGFITNSYSGDDGTSREFFVSPTVITLEEPEPMTNETA